MMPEHALAEVDDDGNPDYHFRYYRYICRCGKAGVWVLSESLARHDHALHRHDAVQPEVMKMLWNDCTRTTKAIP